MITTATPATTRRGRFIAAGAAALGVTIAVTTVFTSVQGHRPAGDRPAVTVAVPSAAPRQSWVPRTPRDVPPSGPAPVPTVSLQELRIATGLPSARAPLTSLAASLASTPTDDAVGPVEYVRELQWAASTTITGSRGTTVIQPMTHQRWWASDGSGQTETRRYRPGTDILVPGAHASDVDTRPYEPGSLPGPAVLPIDDARMDTFLRDNAQPENGIADVISAVADLYSTRVPLPATRAAVLHVLAAADLDWRGHTKDKTGADTLTVSADTHSAGSPGAVRLLLRLHPLTGDVTGFERILLRNPGRLTGRFPQTHDVRIFVERRRLAALPSGRGLPPL